VIRDYWVYQKRAAAHPWALYIVKEFDKRDILPVLDVTFYSEEIQNPTNSKSIVGVTGDNIDHYVNALVTELIDLVDVVTSEDVEQLEKALTDIFIH